MYIKIYLSKYICLCEGRDTCICEGIDRRMVSGRVGVLVCVRHMYITPSESIPYVELES